MAWSRRESCGLPLRTPSAWWTARLLRRCSMPPNNAIFTPHKWGRPTRYEYGQDNVNYGYKFLKFAELSGGSLAYQICPDCGTHVWIEIGDQKVHLSMRLSDFVNVSQFIQVKPERSGLLVRRPLSIPRVNFCHAAADWKLESLCSIHNQKARRHYASPGLLPLHILALRLARNRIGASSAQKPFVETVCVTQINDVELIDLLPNK